MMRLLLVLPALKTGWRSSWDSGNDGTYPIALGAIDRKHIPIRCPRKGEISTLTTRDSIALMSCSAWWMQTIILLCYKSLPRGTECYLGRPQDSGKRPRKIDVSVDQIPRLHVFPVAFFRNLPPFLIGCIMHT